MFLRIKTIEEFERTCLKIDDGITYGYTIDKNDYFKFPLRNKFWNDLIGKKLEVQEDGFYTREGASYQLYRIKKNDFLVPYWFFVENEKKRLEIE